MRLIIKIYLIQIFNLINMKKLLLILFFIPLLVYSDGEKRLALVIGNLIMTKAPLNNPVNDAFGWLKL